MRLRWRLSAVSDLAHIRDYIAANSSPRARDVVDRILHSVERLPLFPRSRRSGRIHGTRELVIPTLPYIVVYTHDDEGIDIVAVFHGAQQRG